MLVKAIIKNKYIKNTSKTKHYILLLEYNGKLLEYKVTKSVFNEKHVNNGFLIFQ